MPPPRPYTLVAELTDQCPLHCPYCSNPVDIGGERWRGELETEHWTRVFREARALAALQLALTGGGPKLGRDPDALAAGRGGARPRGGRGGGGGARPPPPPARAPRRSGPPSSRRRGSTTSRS